VNGCFSHKHWTRRLAWAGLHDSTLASSQFRVHQFLNYDLDVEAAENKPSDGRPSRLIVNPCRSRFSEENQLMNRRAFLLREQTFFIVFMRWEPIAYNVSMARKTRQRGQS
jgi:hypothetical protein